MKETSSGPRKWAFVVIAGGTLFSLPFIQKPEPEPSSSSQSPALDILVPIPDKPTIAELPPISELLRSQDIIPSLTGELASGPVVTGDDHRLPPRLEARSEPAAVVRPVSNPGHESPRIQQPRRTASAVAAESVTSTAPAKDSAILDSAAPNSAAPNSAAPDSAAMNVQSVSSLPRDSAGKKNSLPEWVNANRSKLDELIDESPRSPEFVPDKTLPLQPLRPWIAGPASYAASPAPAPEPVSGNSLASHSARVDAWPHEELTAEQRAKFVTAPALRPRELASAIVPPNQVLHPLTEPASEMASVKRPVLTRAPANAPVSSTVHFGQPNNTAFSRPSSGEPAREQSGKVIFQPR